MTVYDPERWLETTVRGIKDYTESNINTRIYQVVMEFPAAVLTASKVPLNKTVIHFELDDLPERPLGFGDNIGAWNYNGTLHQVLPQEARVQNLNFDVGIWSWDKSGGTTSRMKAKQLLSNLFGGALAQERLDAATNGGDGRIEIITYGGGRFVTDTINDVRTYRMIDCQLEVRVFSRTPMPPAEEAQPTIEEIDQAPNLTIIG